MKNLRIKNFFKYQKEKIMIHIDYANGFIIDHAFLFGNESLDPAYINLATHCGADMRYVKPEANFVDFPGEYDFHGISIQAFVGNQDKLNYLINHQGTVFALIQNPEVLENTSDLGSAQVWLYTTDNVAEKIDQLELEGEKIKLEAPELGD